MQSSSECGSVRFNGRFDLPFLSIDVLFTVTISLFVGLAIYLFQWSLLRINKGRNISQQIRRFTENFGKTKNCFFFILHCLTSPFTCAATIMVMIVEILHGKSPHFRRYLRTCVRTLLADTYPLQWTPTERLILCKCDWMLNSTIRQIWASLDQWSLIICTKRHGISHLHEHLEQNRNGGKSTGSHISPDRCDHLPAITGRGYGCTLSAVSL